MNREITIPGGAGLYPLIGDVQSSPGSNTATVTGLQGVPVTQLSGIQDGDLLQYSAASHSWGPVASTHEESLTDGNSNFIFAAGDIVTVTGVPN